MATRNGSAEWRGDLQGGAGDLTVGDGVFKGSYSFASRFEEGEGTNPEELIAAAHAGCFSMALSGQLHGAGLTADRIETTAKVKLEKVGDGFTVTASHLVVSATIPGADPGVFSKAAEAAKAGCPISRLLNATITMEAKLVG